MDANRIVEAGVPSFRDEASPILRMNSNKNAAPSPRLRTRFKNKTQAIENR
jgi:hypothetical protein